MTSYTPLLISNYETGLERDLKPWLLPNDGFPDLEDCYVFRGRLIRKQGVRHIGRLGLWDYPSGGNPLGTHSSQPQTFTGTFASTPVGRGTVTITDGSTVYNDDGLGDLISTTPNQSITGISNASSAVISFATSPSFSLGDIVWISGNTGMIEISDTPLTVTAVGSTSITVNVDSTTYSTWEADGTVNWYGGTINYSSGAISVTYYSAATSTAVNASAKFYPNLPVMGLTQIQTTAINQETLIAFNTTKSFRLNTVTQQFDDITFTNIPAQTGAFSWTGTDSQFFWSINYANALWTTNFNSSDGLYYLATAGGGAEGWSKFNPTVNNANSTTLTTCLMMVPYRGHLVCINTIEGGTGGGVFPQRARWSQQGTPYYQTGGQNTPPTPFGYDAQSWMDDIQGKGGFADAATREMALSCAFIDDNLIVFFEKSTWILRFQSDSNNPFVWERLNTDFGSESTFSTITFDKGIFTVGNVGITTCDGNDVVRIDQKIPDEVFDFQNINQGPQRVQGIRNFKKQLAYWTFPNLNGSTYPNRVLCLNYVEGSYAIFNDSFTCFGFYEPNVDLTWQTLTSAWQGWDYTWQNPTGAAYDLQVAAGNQQGFVLQVDTQDSPDPSLYVGAITTSGGQTTITSDNHNLIANQFITLSSLFGTGNLAQFTNQVLKVESVVDTNNFVITSQTGNQFDPTYTYIDGGLIAVLNNFSVLTKKFNLGLSEGRQSILGYTDFFVNRDEVGQFTCDIYVDEDNSLPAYTKTVSTAAEPPSSLNLARIWKRAYTRFVGQFFQYNLYLSDFQMYNESFKITDFALHAMVLWVAKAGRLPY